MSTRGQRTASKNVSWSNKKKIQKIHTHTQIPTPVYEVLTGAKNLRFDFIEKYSLKRLNETVSLCPSSRVWIYYENKTVIVHIDIQGR